MMSVMVGFILGYVLGRQFGPLNYDEIHQAWDKIKSSEEVRDTVTGGTMMVSQVLQQRVKALAGQKPSKS
jgi:hypothetical protein